MIKNPLTLKDEFIQLDIKDLKDLKNIKFEFDDDLKMLTNCLN